MAAPPRITALTAREAPRRPFAIDYLDPQLPPGLQVVRMSIVDATPRGLKGYGRLVDDPGECRIVQAHGAWPVPGRDGGLLVGEEHAIPDVPAARDGTERGRAVEPAVNAARPVAAEGAGGCALVRLPVRAQQRGVLAVMPPPPA